MSDIGADLRRARIGRKQSVEDIAQATKITPTLVRAIESEAFAKLPGGLFTRGFLRAYAREVGLDPEEIVERYRAEFEPRSGPDVETPAQPEAVRVSGLRAAVAIDDESTRARFIQILQLCIILLIVALYFAAVRRPKPQAANDVNPVAPAATTSKAETPVATNGTVATAQSSPLTLELQATGPCWVEATADGARVFGRLLDAGQRATITVRDDVMLRVGDPGTLAFTIDGAKGRQLGEAGHPVWVRLNRTNYKTFLDPPRQ